jgi:hypothetical protein
MVLLWPALTTRAEGARRLAITPHRSRELDWTERASRADPDCQEGEESHKRIVRDLQAFGAIYTRLKYERGW